MVELRTAVEPFPGAWQHELVHPDRVQVRMRHKEDEAGCCYVLGWFEPHLIDDVLVTLKRYPIHFGELEHDTDPNDVEVQVIAEGGVVCIEFVFGSGDDE